MAAYVSTDPLCGRRYDKCSQFRSCAHGMDVRTPSTVLSDSHAPSILCELNNHSFGRRNKALGRAAS